jgi:D-glucuronyl C5-epimerase C-terminus
VLAWSPVAARAARVIVLDRAGHATARDDPFLPATASTAAPLSRPDDPAGPAHAAAGRTVRSELTQLLRAHAITASAYRRYRADVNGALTDLKHLSSTRGRELEAVVENLHDIAASGKLIPSRLPALFATLERNRQWWKSGPLLSYGQRVEFAGSMLVWEFYPGQGIQLQELGSFGKAQGLCAAGPSDAAQCKQFLAELIPLAARRAGGLTWEYYFKFDGGNPPWTSAMSQGTALQALADASRSLHDPSYLDVARRALPVFTRPPPAGVAVRTSRGARYLQYSFAAAPGDNVINGFLQSLIGLQDYAQVSGNSLAKRLFAAGDAEARFEVPHFDTGAWSLYQPGEEDSLDYHELVTEFLHQLCAVTSTSVYCSTASRFDEDLKTPPVLALLTTQLKAKQPARISFRVSKISRVGITVSLHGKTVFLTSASFGYGVHSFAISSLARAGSYSVGLDATDLAGNYGQTAGTIKVSR